MILETLNLINFRNYSKANFTFSSDTTLVVGPNTSGKTNLLEAIYFLAAGKSFRAGFDRETIRRSEGLCHLRGGIECDDGHLELELQIVANENGENTSSKKFKVNGVKKRLADFAGNLRSVYFGPEEIQLVTGPPSRRRKYLDSVLIQVDRKYARALSEYEKVLRQRNRLLLLIREGEQNRSQLDFWDEKLLGLAEILSGKRGSLIDCLNCVLEGKLKLIVYQSKRSHAGIYDLREREIAAGMTLWGPHREDFVFEIKNRDLSRFGSRGEQRLAVLHLKLAELEFITQRVGPPASSRARPPASSLAGEVGWEASRAGERPVLLLDDIFSELDEENCQHVLSLLGKQQTIVTSADPNILSSKLKSQNAKPHIKTINLQKI